MDKMQFWRQKLIQFFHDPVNKPLTGYGFAGKQVEFAKKYAELAIGHRIYTNKFTRPADWAAAGADRPVLNPPGRGRHSRPVTWYREPLVTHPLADGRYRLQLEKVGDQSQQSQEEDEATLAPVDLVWRSDDEAEQAAREMGEQIQGWAGADADSLKRDYLRLYRELPDRLIGKGENGALWSLLPADSRVPDHSIWDHIKVTCALNYMLYEPDLEDKKRTVLPTAREPWLVRFSLGPVARFIEQARTGRDLWTASYLLSDLMWQAVQVVVERYGPDCIVYPDLRGNPRADHWLVTRHDLLSEENPNSLAATIPNAFVALLPRGEAGHLQVLDSLVEEARKAIHERWESLRETVFAWMESLELEDGWQDIWKRQNRLPLRIAWNAVPWRKAEPISDPESVLGPALPARKPDAPEWNPSPEDRAAIEQRRERLKPWVPQDVWTAHEQARSVFARLNLGYLQNERGFDYALTHHQLGARHQLGKQAPEALPEQGEPGEKCTLCGEREALWAGAAAKARGIDGRRAQVRRFWTHQKLDPDETGAERLCSVCAVKRFLVEAGHDGKALTDFTQSWAGAKTDYRRVVDVRASMNKVRQPFPSTSMIAAQRFIVELADKAAELGSEIDAVTRACQAAGRQRTAFPDALAQLAPLHRGGPLHDFLEYDPQDTLFPTALEGEIARLQAEGRHTDADKLKRLQRAVERLLDKAIRLGVAPPNRRIAVIKIDGDQMGKLLLGAGERMGATWRDVLHPQMLARIENAPDDADNPYLDAYWPELLQARRLMGPSLHAFISRALGHFAHRMVPWVVEREFSARLIYTGGDDVLCIAPADEALDIVARLQQLWSAAWVVDRGNTDGKVNGYHSEWSWRLPGWEGEYDSSSVWRQARQRFQILAPAGGAEPIRWPVEDPAALQAHCSGEGKLPVDGEHPLKGEILPMLGPVQSLSAGIAFAHFKTSMSHLVRTAEHLLDDVAKDKAGRGAVAVKLFSRNADKAEFALNWTDAERSIEAASDAQDILAHKRLQAVISGFADGVIPGRLPYKLREQLRVVGLTEAWKNPDEGPRLRRGMLASALDGKLPTRLRGHLLAIWERGVELWPDEPERSLDGLLFCRAMASDASEEE